MESLKSGPPNPISEVERPETPEVLCVDLEALVSTSLLHEAILELARNRPRKLYLLPLWWMRGRDYLWSMLLSFVQLDASQLPISQDVLAFVRDASFHGRRTILVTEADPRIAETVAQYAACFNEVIAVRSSTPQAIGQEKAATLINRFGPGNFDYLASSAVAVPAWNLANRAILAPGAPDRSVQKLSPGKQLSSIRMPRESASRKKPAARTLLRAMRPHQWSKNFLVLAPLLLAHRWSAWHSLAPTIAAFVSFCLASSGIYFANDLLDLTADRAHPLKRNRPLAAGELSIPLAVGSCVALCIGALSLAYAAKPIVAFLIGLYLLLTGTYSLRFKRVMLLDAMLLSSFYVLRIFTGGAAASVTLSPWTLGFAVFLFLSLALMKRCSELANLQRKGAQRAARRGYLTSDLSALSSLGMSVGVVAALIVALYITSPDVSALYRTPDWLWFICPALLMWICRLWIITGRGEMHEDPIAFALKDKWSLLIGGFVLLAWLLAL